MKLEYLVLVVVVVVVVITKGFGGDDKECRLFELFSFIKCFLELLINIFLKVMESNKKQPQKKSIM